MVTEVRRRCPARACHLARLPPFLGPGSGIFAAFSSGPHPVLNRNVEQPYKTVGIWLIDQWRKVGLNVDQWVEWSRPRRSSRRSGTGTSR
jgi:hypothetical protein